jgi:hypothetical protein
LFRRKDPQLWLKRKYIGLLRNDYRLPSSIIEEMSVSPRALPAFSNLAEAASWFEDNFQEIGKQHSNLPNEYWGKLLSDLIAVVPLEHALRNVPVFVGQVPDVRFNAYTPPFGRRGYIVLFNQGLAMLLEHTAKLLVAGMNLALGKQVTRSLPEMKRLMRRAFDLIFGKAPPFWITLTTHEAVSLYVVAHYALEQAVLAHELGHVTQFLQPKYARANQYAIELFSDNVGSSLCLNLITSESRALGIPPVQAEFVLTAAPIWVCYVMDAFERSATRLGIKLANTHPNGLVRAEAQRRKYRELDIPPLDDEFVSKSCELLVELTADV